MSASSFYMRSNRFQQSSLNSFMIKLCKHIDCTGCTACAGVCIHNAIQMVASDEGFLYPIIDGGLCRECHLCEKTCPVIKVVPLSQPVRSYAAWSLDKKVRTHSSSGGIFSELARFIFQNGGVVVGASLDDSSGIVKHIIVDKFEDIFLIQGSKYVQSIISPEIYRQIRTILHNGRKVLFTGTPCQVAGLISATHNHNNLFTMDIVCHGVPSPKWFQQIHHNVREKIKNFVNYNFRQLSSWSVCPNVNVNVNGKIINRELHGVETCYQDAFLKGYLHRENCYQCRYAGIKRVADVTVADFWGIGTISPISDDYNLGCSLMLVNTSKGEILFKGIQNRIFSEPRDVKETINAGNDQLKEPSYRPAERNNFYIDAFSIPLTKLIEKYELKYTKEPTIWIRFKSKVKYILSQ